jgi:hypothetical protein
MSDSWKNKLQEFLQVRLCNDVAVPFTFGLAKKIIKPTHNKNKTKKLRVVLNRKR